VRGRRSNSIYSKFTFVSTGLQTSDIYRWTMRLFPLFTVPTDAFSCARFFLYRRTIYGGKRGGPPRVVSRSDAITCGAATQLDGKRFGMLLIGTRLLSSEGERYAHTVLNALLVGRDDCAVQIYFTVYEGMKKMWLPTREGDCGKRQIQHVTTHVYRLFRGLSACLRSDPPP
jgi:hypothetical protein